MSENPEVPPPPLTVWVDFGAILPPWKNGDDSGTTHALDVLLKLSFGAKRTTYFWVHHWWVDRSLGVAICVPQSNPWRSATSRNPSPSDPEAPWSQGSRREHPSADGWASQGSR